MPCSKTFRCVKKRIRRISDITPVLRDAAATVEVADLAVQQGADDPDERWDLAMEAWQPRVRATLAIGLAVGFRYGILAASGERS